MSVLVTAQAAHVSLCNSKDIASWPAEYESLCHEGTALFVGGMRAIGMHDHPFEQGTSLHKVQSFLCGIIIADKQLPELHAADESGGCRICTDQEQAHLHLIALCQGSPRELYIICKVAHQTV